MHDGMPYGRIQGQGQGHFTQRKYWLSCCVCPATDITTQEETVGQGTADARGRQVGGRDRRASEGPRHQVQVPAYSSGEPTGSREGLHPVRPSQEPLKV